MAIILVGNVTEGIPHFMDLIYHKENFKISTGPLDRTPLFGRGGVKGYITTVSLITAVFQVLFEATKNSIALQEEGEEKGLGSKILSTEIQVLI